MFTAEEKEKTLIIKIPKSPSEEAISKLELDIKMWMAKPLTLYVLDMAEVFALNSDVVRILLNFGKTLNSNEKFMMSINVSSGLSKKLKDDGLENGFGVVGDLSEAYKKAGLTVKKKVKLDVEFLKPFIDSTLNTFSTQLEVDLKQGKPFVKTSRSKI